MYPYERSSILLIHSYAMDKWGGPIAFAGLGAAENKGIACGGSATIRSRFSLGQEGALLRGVSIALGICCMIPISLHSFSQSLIHKY